MTITSFASGTKTATGGEDVLSAPNVVGEFAVELDLSVMASGDVLEVRAYKIVLTGGASRVMWFQAFYGAQPASALIPISNFIPNDLTDSNAVQFTIKQTFGTNRSYPWKVFNRDATADVVKWNGTAVSSPATAGIPDVNVKNINNVSAGSVTTVNANQGTTQPVNFTGSGASALAKSDMVDVAGAAVSTSTAQIGVNTVNLGGTAQTGRDIGASVLLSPGTGTGQLDFTSGVVKANLVQILGTALTETAGLIAAGFKQFFNIASPTSTMNTITTVTTTTTATNLTNAPTSGDFTAAMKTSLNAATPAVTVSDKTGFSLSAAGIQAIWDRLTSALTTVGSIGKLLVDNIDATISSRTKPADTQAAVTTVTNLTNAPTSGDFTAAMKTSLNAATPASVVGAVGSVTGNVGGNVVGTVASVVGAVGSVTGNIGGNVVGSVGSVVATVSANLAQILGTALTETTTGWLAAAFKKFFNLATPTSTMNEITLVDTTTALTNPVASVAGAVGSVTGNVGGNVTGSVGSLAAQAKTDVAQAVLNAVAASYDTAGTIGEQINNAGSGGSSPTVQQIVDGVWDEPNADHVDAGSTGLNLSLIPGINARVQSGSITITDGFNAHATILTIKQYQTYSAATNPLQVTVSIPVDPTGADIFLTLLQANVATQFDGTCLSYNVSTSEATLNFDMTSTESGALKQYDGEFAVSVVDGSNDVFQSIVYPAGTLKVKIAPLMPPV